MFTTVFFTKHFKPQKRYTVQNIRVLTKHTQFGEAKRDIYNHLIYITFILPYDYEILILPSCSKIILDSIKTHAILMDHCGEKSL